LANYKNIPPRHRRPREIKDYRKIYADKRNEMLDVIEKNGTIGEAHLKIKLGWGDGMYKARKSEIIQLHSQELNWNSHTKIFTWLEIDKPLTEETLEKEV